MKNALECGFMRKRRKKEEKMEKRKEKQTTCFGSDLGKGRRLPIPNIPGDEWENRSARGKKNISRMQCKPYDINVDEGFTAIKAQENKQTNKTKQTKNTKRENVCKFLRGWWSYGPKPFFIFYIFYFVHCMRLYIFLQLFVRRIVP